MRLYHNLKTLYRFLTSSEFALFQNEVNFKYKAANSKLFQGVRIDGAQYISIGSKTTIQRHSWLYAGKHTEFIPELTIGENCAIGDFAHITAVKKVVIGDSVLMANRVYISDNYHSFENPNIPIIDQPVCVKNEVNIGSGSWIGENVCIIGASVGKNSVIGANAVVTHDIPDFCVAVGSPAIVIKKFDIELQKWIKTI